MTTLEEDRATLNALLNEPAEDRIQHATAVFTFIHDHPHLLSVEVFKEITRQKIIELRRYIRQQHADFANVVKAMYTEKTEAAKLRFSQEANKSRRFHPLQNAMDDVWKLIQ